jgi:hypothetical protein
MPAASPAPQAAVKWRRSLARTHRYTCCSVWHIKNVIQPELETKLAAEQAKPRSSQDRKILNNLQQVQ